MSDRLMTPVDRLAMAVRVATKGAMTAEEARSKILKFVERVRYVTVRDYGRFHFDVQIKAGDDPESHHFVCNRG